MITDYIEDRIRSINDIELKRILDLNFYSENEIILIALSEAEKRRIEYYRIAELKDLIKENSREGIKITKDKRLNKWNWGAFILNGFWAYPNGLKKIGLLSFIPGFNFLTMFYFGINGTRLAWKNNKTFNFEEYLELQKTWSMAAIKLCIYILFIMILEKIIT